MSFINAHSFVFDGTGSDTFNLVICWINKEPDVSANGLKKTLQKGELNNARYISNVYGASVNENISFTFDIAKIDFSPFTKEESIEINAWLTGANTPRLLHFNDYDVPSIDYYAVCTSIDDIIINGRNAKTVTFETNAPFGFMSEITKKCIVEGSAAITIENLSDTMDGIYYPEIKLITKNAVTIENNTEHKSVTITPSEIAKDKDGNYILSINNRTQVISDKNGNLIPFNKFGWGPDYKSKITSAGETDQYIDYIYWFRLVKGVNNISIYGDCTIEFKYKFPRKVGCV